MSKVVDLEGSGPGFVSMTFFLPVCEPGSLLVKCVGYLFGPSCFGVLEFFCLVFSWTKLTERFFKNTPWPEAEAIAPQVGNGRYEFFCVLYAGWDSVTEEAGGSSG